MIALGISMTIFPKSIKEVSGLSDFIYGNTNIVIIFLVVTVMPAICEEAIQRGAILSHLRSLEKDWAIILIMGAFFGLFHLSVLRFLSTAALGALLTYLMVKKNNFLLPMIMHFSNNLIAMAFGSIGNVTDNTSDVLESVSGLQILGIYCLFGFLAPVLLVLAFKLLNKEEHKTKYWIIAIIVSAVLFVVGIASLIYTSFASTSLVLSTSGTYEFTAEKTSEDAQITVEEDGTYVISCVGNVKGGTIGFKITDQDGKEVYNKKSEKTLFVSANLKLEKGEYTFSEFAEEDAFDKDTTITLMVYRMGGKKTDK